MLRNAGDERLTGEAALDEAFRSWLDQLGLAQHAEALASQDIDFRSLDYLNEDDLKELGLSLGHRRILLAAIKERSAEGDSGQTTPAAQSATPSPASTDAGHAERRQLTVMFCDLVGSTPLSRRFDPEALQEILRRYHNAVASAVIDYGGHVAKLLGDGVLAYFGWPRAYEDQAERAVRAALDAIAGVEAILLEDGHHLQARVGIATGEVLIGDILVGSTREKEAVIGETPNLAARLQALANPGKIVIGAHTRPLLGTSFILEDIGNFELKGFDEPVHAWRVDSEADVESRFEAAHGEGLTDLIGREHERGLIRAGWAQAVAGEGRVMLLSGEAGIGKSRIVQDFRSELPDKSYYSFHFQCSPLHLNSTFHPVVQRLRSGAGFVAADDAETKLNKMEAYVARRGADIAEIAPVLANLLSLPGEARYGSLDLSPQQLKNRAIEILIGHMLRQAERHPVLCVVEDMHWADPSTVEMIGEVTARIADHSVYVLITYRPDFDPPWPDLNHVSQLKLNRLGRRQTAEIAEAMAGSDILDALLEQIVVRSDGVPLFVEELTKAVLENVSSDQPSVIDELIPATLQSSLVARLDRLEEAKMTAQTAAVIGREIPYDLLYSVVDCDQEQLRADLDRLVISGMVNRRGRPPNATYSFKHALLQDAAYATITRSERQRLHTKIVGALETQTGSNTIERIDTLAHHACQAELWEKAFTYLHLAGVKAMDRAGLREAVAQFEHALNVSERLPESVETLERTIDLRFELRNALWALGRFEAILSHLADSVPLVAKLGDPVRKGWISVFESASFWQLGRRAQAIETAEHALDVSREAGDLSLEVAAHFYLGCPLMTSGNYERAEATFQSVVDRLKGDLSRDRCGLPFVPAVIARSWLVWSLAERGKFAAGLEIAEDALAIAEEVGHPFNIAHLYYDLGYYYEIKGDIDLGVEALGKAVDLIETWRLTYLSPFIKGFYGHVLALAGRHDEGVQILEEAERLYEEIGLGLFRSLVGLQLGEAYLIAGRCDDALTKTKQALALARKRGERGHEAYGLRILGNVLTARGDDEEAMVTYQGARALAASLGLRPLTAMTELCMGRLLGRMGQDAKAARHVDQARKMAEAMGMTLRDLPPCAEQT
ncbi:MAG: adenylate/guanylate cyclase domain-containing protein [Geminicoccaceae bacterium]